MLNAEQPDWLTGVIKLIKEHPDQSFTLEQIGKLSGMSVSSVTSKFKRHTGKTLKEFQHDIQIQIACRMLIETNLKVIEICQHVGFGDLSFFYKIFKRKCKMPPLQYRKYKAKWSCP